MPPISAGDGYQNQNDWSEWRKHVLLELERLNTNYEKISDRVTAIQQDYFIMKGKLIGVGAVSALVVSVLLQLLFKFVTTTISQ